MPKKNFGPTAERAKRGEVLVVIVNNHRDWEIVRDQLWYRIPVKHTPRRWPPGHLAFFFTKVFGEDAHRIRFYGKVAKLDRVQRKTLFPDQAFDPRAEDWYHQIHLVSVEELSKPIGSRPRRIVFIPTTEKKLREADEINDLFDDSPLEDALWKELKKRKVPVDRQYYVESEGEWFALDFAIFCKNGKIDVETDGDTWHVDKGRATTDNQRNNALAADDWKVLRFNTMQVREQMNEYCVKKILETVSRLGGLEDGTDSTRAYYRSRDGVVEQMNLFESKD
ncbi:MAG: DUF559 domain-containing protein [Chthonomonadaceae bacterium]|nr:DUF559 domain-containing protein [Chthonomonadaceae bacterium]